MVKPEGFGFNKQTSDSNSFQHEPTETNVLNKAQREFGEMVLILQDRGIDVEVVEDEGPGLPDSIFPNNWISHTDSRLIIYPMFTENRRGEVRQDVIDRYANKLAVTEVLNYSDRVKEGLFLEGTGSIIFDHENKLAFACISPRTNMKLLNEICEKIGYKSISFESLDLKGGQIYHTNVMLSLALKFAVVCLESIPDLLERALLLKTLEKTGREIVEIDYQQMNSFAANALEVLSLKGESYFCLSKTSFDVLNEDQIKTMEKTAELLPISIPTIEKVGGGSVRCMMAGFFNYPK